MDLPVNVPDFVRAVKAASPSRSPGPDGTSYKFYKAAFMLVGPAMANGLNSVLEKGQLSLSLCQGVIRLLPWVTP
jgi:hypothetical protein